MDSITAEKSHLALTEQQYQQESDSPLEDLPVGEPLGQLDPNDFCDTDDLNEEEVRVYKPLSATHFEIRLIKLTYATTQSDLLSCTLHQYPTWSVPAYVALSYCWGKSLDMQRSLVNGFNILISSNLCSALQALRGWGDIQVWCDRLYINQADFDERAQQIGHMKSIFQNATRVVVWLGEEADGSSQCMETLNRWTKYRSCHDDLGDVACWEAMWREDVLRSAGPVPEHQILAMIAKSYSLLLKQVNALLQRDYWRRVWVVQEVAVGNRVTVHCGLHSAEWHELARCLRSLQMRKAYYDTSDPVAKGYRGFEAIQELRSKISLGRPIQLLRALQDSYRSKATDHRDKVFALLGVSLDAHQYVPAISYKDTLQDTILHMTINAIKSTGNLDFICMQGLTQPRDSARDLRLPTWAPRWLSIGNHPYNDRMVRYLTRQVEHVHFDRASIMWNASCDTHRFEAEFLSNDSVLCVEGALVGIIDGLTPAAGLPAWSNLHQSKTLDHEFTSHADMETLSDIYETLNMEEGIESLRDETVKYNYFWCINKDKVSLSSLRSVCDWFGSIKDFKVRGTPMRRWIQNGELLAKEDLDHATMRVGIRIDRLRNDKSRERSVEQALAKIPGSGMRLMTTKEGDIGWAHPLALPNDGVFLLRGCSIPVILRELDDDQGQLSFQVIGDAYVHGIMHGELWQQASEQLQKVYLH